jgi:hypothetical protein
VNATNGNVDERTSSVQKKSKGKNRCGYPVRGLYWTKRRMADAKITSPPPIIYFHDNRNRTKQITNEIQNRYWLRIGALR